MTPEFKALYEAVARLMDIERSIIAARAIPSTAKYQADRVKVYADDGGCYNRVPPEIIARVKAAAVACAEQLRVEGEAERDRQLIALSSEVQALRAVLPSLAARASISLGAFASDLHEEAPA